MIKYIATQTLKSPWLILQSYRLYKRVGYTGPLGIKRALTYGWRYRNY